MKNIIYLIVFFTVNFVYTQTFPDLLQFTYDAAGNQTSRCLNCYIRKSKDSVVVKNSSNVEKSVVRSIDKDFEYFPNPVNDYLKLTWKINKPQFVTVYDLNGKLLFYDEIHTEDVYQLFLEQYSQGIYVIKVVFEDNTVKTFSVIKK